MRWACDNGQIGYNPVDEYRKRAHDTEAPPARRAAQPLDEHQLAALLNAAERKWRPAFACAAEAGLHTSELLPVRSSDLTETDLNVSRYVTRTGEIAEYGQDDPKRRAIPLSGRLRETLAEYREVARANSNDELLFPSKSGGLRTARSVDLALKRATTRSGLTATSRSLRDTFASARIAAGLDLSELTRQLGYATFEGTYQAYRRLFRQAGRDREAQQVRRATFTEIRNRKRPPTASS
jgi:integrase